MNTRRGVTGSLRVRVFERDHYICQYCGSIDDLSIDHIWPQSKGGSDEISNLITSCEKCNASKGGRTLREWITGERERKLVIIDPKDFPEDSPEKMAFDVRAEKASRFIDGVLREEHISQNVWCGVGKLFSRKEYERFIANLLGAGIIEWKNKEHHQQGAVLSHNGKQKLRIIRGQL